MEVLGDLPERISAHLDRGYDSNSTRQKLAERGLLAERCYVYNPKTGNFHHYPRHLTRSLDALG